nr:Uma2 family endonuclease [Siminovitchia fortis]
MEIAFEEAVSLEEFSKKPGTFEEYLQLREERAEYMEFSDGAIFMAPSPSTMHQRISGRLYVQFFNYMKSRDCEVFHAPFDVELQGERLEGTHIVIPDLLVICDKEGLKETKYVGAPELIIEILSPSNQAHDLVFKMNLYMQAGVKEYWIVNPMLHTIQAYQLDQDGQYRQNQVLKDRGTIKSAIFEGVNVDLEALFA